MTGDCLTGLPFDDKLDFGGEGGDLTFNVADDFVLL